MSRTYVTPGTSGRPAAAAAPRTTPFAVLIGLTSLAVLLQAVWAGLFLREGISHDASESWVSVHARGADVALGLAVIAFVVALVTLRSRKDLLVGSAVLAVALALEAYIGGAIGDNSALTVVHIPLAMVIMALAVWLPLRIRAVGRARADR